ncbi:MAG: phage minor head protein [Pseudomonadota bacterium]
MPKRDDVRRAREAHNKKHRRTVEKANGEVRAILARAGEEIKRKMQAAPSEWQAHHLSQIRDEVERILDGAGRTGGASIAAGMSEASRIGVAITDQQLLAGGFNIAARFPRLDLAQLEGLQSTMTKYMHGLTSNIIQLVDEEIQKVAVGIAAPSDAITAIDGMVDGGRRRAKTVVRTELGRANSVATQARQEQAAAELPGLQKEWISSGKRFSRLTHDVADGQVVSVDQPFHIGADLLMFPRDPAGSPEETINCGCISAPHHPTWEAE